MEPNFSPAASQDIQEAEAIAKPVNRILICADRMARMIDQLGTLHVESCEEKGTRFVIGLPRHPR